MDRVRRRGVSSPESSSWWGAIALSLLWSTLPACGPQPVAVPADLPANALVLRPGDSLLEHTERFTVSAFPQSTLPTAVGRRLVELWSADPWTIAADDWLGGQPLPAGAGASLGHEPTQTLYRWRCRPAVRLDLAAGRLELTHEQRTLRPLFQATAARELQWNDETAGLLFWWIGDEEALVALGPRAPGAVSFRYRADVRVGLSRFERTLAAGGLAPQAGAELFSRARVGAVDRPALAAPAPTILELHIDLLAGDTLRVATAIDELGLGWSPAPSAEQRGRGGWVDDPRVGLRRLRPREAQGDGVVFAIEVTFDGEVFPVWSRRIEPGKGWREESIDLSFFAGRSITLALITRPGSDNSSLFDHALWGDLTLEGVVAGHPDRPHVVLLDLPGLASADLGLAASETPLLREWAEGVERWDAVTSPAHERLPAAVSLLSGQTPAEHGVLGAADRLPESGAELVARLAAAGYETLARTDGGHLVPELGFAGSFSRFDYQRLDLDTLSGGSWSRELARVTERRSARPLFLFLSSAQMLPPRSEAADALEQLDGVVGPLLRDIDEALGGEPTLIVVTSDHARTPSGSTVPLLVRWPPGWRSAPRSRDGSAEVTTLDVAATILDLAGLPPSPGLTGQSLAER